MTNEAKPADSLPSGPSEPVVATPPENPLHQVAIVAHGWYGRIAEIAREAQADIEKFVPAGVLQSVEQTAAKDVEGATQDVIK